MTTLPSPLLLRLCVSAASLGALRRRLPAPVSSALGGGGDGGLGSFAGDSDGEEGTRAEVQLQRSGPPPYMQREGFVPTREADFGDGGAFPEVLVAQFPLEMGKTAQTVSSSGAPSLPSLNSLVVFRRVV